MDIEVKDRDKALNKKMSEQEIKKEIRRRRDRDRTKVKGVFRFHEVPGGTLSFPFYAYEGDEVEHYTLTDGKIYEIPLGVARHLNTNCWYPEHAYVLDENGTPKMQMNKKVRRASFQSLEFMDIDEHQADADIVTARPV